jgi:uncharacterized membrane protein
MVSNKSEALIATFVVSSKIKLSINLSTSDVVGHVPGRNYMVDEVKTEEVKTDEVKTEAPKAAGGTGLEPNTAALLAYLFGWVGGLVFFLLEKEDKFVRFAAMQSIVFNVAGVALYFVFLVFTGILAAVTNGLGALLGLLIPVVWIGYVVVWVLLMVKAYQNQEWELPVIGKIARNAVK